MGEMADYVLDNAFMPADDSYDDDQEPRSTRCIYCGRRNLHWLRTERGWRLFDSFEQMHSCKQHDGGVDDS